MTNEPSRLTDERAPRESRCRAAALTCAPSRWRSAAPIAPPRAICSRTGMARFPGRNVASKAPRPECQGAGGAGAAGRAAARRRGWPAHGPGGRQQAQVARSADGRAGTRRSFEAARVQSRWRRAAIGRKRADRDRARGAGRSGCATAAAGPPPQGPSTPAEPAALEAQHAGQPMRVLKLQAWRASRSTRAGGRPRRAVETIREFHRAARHGAWRHRVPPIKGNGSESTITTAESMPSSEKSRSSERFIATGAGQARG